MEWDNYVALLASMGIQLINDVDSLVGSFNCKLGLVTANLAYQFLVEKLLSVVDC